MGSCKWHVDFLKYFIKVFACFLFTIIACISMWDHGCNGILYTDNIDDNMMVILIVLGVTSIIPVW